ncbi:MAG: serine--tRNA ligase [Bacteroidetes bacterium]|nr:serine--tRNA ligase [Bacteroidota bacterium]
MLLVSDLRADIEAVKEKLGRRNFKALHLVDDAIGLDDKRKLLQTNRDEILAKRNTLSKGIGQLFQSGKREEAESMKSEIASLKEEVTVIENSLEEVYAGLRDILLTIPNLPHHSVPHGMGEDDNEITFVSEENPATPESAIPHWELAKKFDIIDFETGVKITGAGFTLYKGKGAALLRALQSFFLDEAIDAGYLEVVPPLMVNEASAYGTGQLPDKEGQMYHVTADDLYLIPTAEVPITNIYRDVIVPEKELPVRLTGYTPCFRREAGSYGSHVRGLNRVHQFEKVEIVQIVKPESSYQALDDMVSHVEGLLKKLELPYRILRLCGADIGFTSSLTYDFEVFSSAQKRWLEVSSVSNFESFQANRLKLRFKDADGKKQLCHTLNGSAIALTRIVACLLENNQSGDSIEIPEVLRSYTRFDKITL